jgi:hypothetical protein
VSIHTHCERTAQNISEPLLYKRIQLTAIGQVRMLARTFIIRHGLMPNIGPWVKVLVLTHLHDLMAGWDLIYSVLCRMTALTEVRLGQHLTPSFVSVLAASSSSSTLRDLSISSSMTSIPELAYIGDMRNLRIFRLHAPTATFFRSFGTQPWCLPHLHTLEWTTAKEKATCSADFLSRCQLPSLVTLYFMTPLAKASAGAALARALQGNPSVEIFATNLHEEGFTDLLLDLPALIHRLIIHSPRKSIVPLIPPTVTTLVLVCVDPKEDIPRIYEVLDRLLDAGRLDLIIKFTFQTKNFFWLGEFARSDDLPVPRSELITTLLWYAGEGLRIQDDSGKTMKEYLP